tara:strand:+ start:1784 stop:2530 length:747 start_codon:yes stop_codon:yes gene_type:complete
MNTNFQYLSKGKGQPIIILHGLMGGLSNFNEVFNFFPAIGYRVIAPQLPVYSSNIMDTNLKYFSKYIYSFIKHLGLENVILLGNSMGGHIGLIFSKIYPDLVRGLVLTGSSGLYENSMGDSYPKREDYDFIKTKTENVFYSPKIATKKLIDEVYESVNNRKKLIKILALAKSAIRHNMSKDLPKIKIPTALIWGKNDNVTPPDVAIEFNKLMPNSDLFWIDKCGHAPMMEHPKKFNEILKLWFLKNKF